MENHISIYMPDSPPVSQGTDRCASRHYEHLKYILFPVEKPPTDALDWMVTRFIGWHKC